MNKIKIVHWVVSATAHYLCTLNYSLKNLHNLLPSSEYSFRVTVITNPDNKDLDSIRKFSDEILKDSQNYNIFEIEFKDCPDFPWPVLTLYKPFLCSKYIKKDDDFVLCGNCNISIKENDYSWFDSEKINVSWHHSHPEPYYNTKPYYIQGGFVLANKELMRNFCKIWQEQIDYQIKYEHKVPDWHDETILNMFFNHPDFKHLFKPTFKFYVNGYKKEPDAFIGLNLNHVNNEFKGEK